MSIISAGTSSSTAVKITGNTDGTLVLRTNDTGSGGTTALTLATNQAATFASTVTATGLTNSGLTSGRVVYSTTGGAQTDSSNLTFNGTTLTAGGFTTTGATATGTLTASGAGTFNFTGSGAGLIVNGSTGGYEDFRNNGSTYGFIGYADSLTATGGNNFAVRSVGNLQIAAGGSAVVSTFSSTGLAVTGTVSATGEAAIGGSSQQVKINRASDATSYGAITFNNDFGSTTMTGLFGRGSGGDAGKLFLNAPTGQTIASTIAGNTVTSVSSTGLAVTGQISSTNAIFGVRNNVTSTDRISVTGATTIFSIGTGGSSVGASGAVILVNGYNTASNTNSFIDLVLFIGSNTPTVLGSVNRGSPAARTYTASGNNLQLAMASGTYNVANSSTEQAC